MLESNYIAELIRIGGIAGILYHRKKLSSNLLIYGYGAPTVPDNGSLKEAEAVMKFDTDFFVPDYIGYGRSDGVLTPRNCVQTFLKLYSAFKNGCTAVNYYKKSKTQIRYKRIMFAGRSFGGTYVPLLPKFNQEITEICLVFPAIDNKNSGSVKGEETNEDFLRAMRQDGYWHLYRGILSKAWQRHLNTDDALSPMVNIGSLKKAKIFIGHGRNDNCIDHSKSVSYYTKVLDMFPNKKHDINLKIYDNGGHNSETACRILSDFLNWLKLEKKKKRLH